MTPAEKLGFVVGGCKATININGFDVPEPCREPLEYGTLYYTARLSFGKYNKLVWGGDPIDYYHLKNGLIHLNKKAAKVHSKALRSFTSA